MKRSYAEYGTETRIEPTEGTCIYSLVFIPYVSNMSSKHLALQVIKYVYGINTDVIDVCLETIHSIGEEVGIIT